MSRSSASSPMIFSMKIPIKGSLQALFRTFGWTSPTLGRIHHLKAFFYSISTILNKVNKKNHLRPWASATFEDEVLENVKKGQDDGESVKGQGRHESCHVNPFVPQGANRGAEHLLGAGKSSNPEMNLFKKKNGSLGRSMLLPRHSWLENATINIGCFNFSI